MPSTACVLCESWRNLDQAENTASKQYGDRRNTLECSPGCHHQPVLIISSPRSSSLAHRPTSAGHCGGRVDMLFTALVRLLLVSLLSLPAPRVALLLNAMVGQTRSKFRVGSRQERAETPGVVQQVSRSATYCLTPRDKKHAGSSALLLTDRGSVSTTPPASRTGYQQRFQ